MYTKNSDNQQQTTDLVDKSTPISAVAEIKLAAINTQNPLTAQKVINFTVDNSFLLKDKQRASVLLAGILDQLNINNDIRVLRTVTRI